MTYVITWLFAVQLVTPIAHFIKKRLHFWIKTLFLGHRNISKNSKSMCKYYNTAIRSESWHCISIKGRLIFCHFTTGIFKTCISKGDILQRIWTEGLSFNEQNIKTTPKLLLSFSNKVLRTNCLWKKIITPR